MVAGRATKTLRRMRPTVLFGMLHCLQLARLFLTVARVLLSWLFCLRFLNPEMATLLLLILCRPVEGANLTQRARKTMFDSVCLLPADLVAHY